MKKKSYFKGIVDGVRIPMDFLTEIKGRVEHLSALDSEITRYDGEQFIDIIAELDKIAEAIEEFQSRTYDGIEGEEIQLFTGEVINGESGEDFVDTATILRELERKSFEQE